MAPAQRTPQQRDRRFARVRHVTQAIFLGSCATSALFVCYAANAAHSDATAPAATFPTTTTSDVTTTTEPATTTTKPETTTTVRERTTPTTEPAQTPTTLRVVPTTPTTVRRVAPTTIYAPPTTAPVTTTTICASTPSGRVICY
jgi:hypothetical protein